VGEADKTIMTALDKFYKVRASLKTVEEERDRVSKKYEDAKQTRLKAKELEIEARLELSIAKQKYFDTLDEYNCAKQAAFVEWIESHK
jgi:F0F1-type ATP synthase membrane subunit b/b'